MVNAPSASYSQTVRLEINNKPGMLGKVTSAIGKAGGDIGAIDLVEVGKSTMTATSIPTPMATFANPRRRRASSSSKNLPPSVKASR